MFTRSTVGLAGFVATVGAFSGPFECGSEPTKKQVENTNALMQAAPKFSTLDGSIARNTTTVTLHFHVIHADETTQGGYLDDDTIEKQLDVLNEEYGSRGFVFDLEDTEYYENEEWATNGGDDEAWDEIKRETRKGGYDELNVWFGPDLGAGIGGWCTFPEEDADDDVQAVDGCIVGSFTVPDGDWENYNTGKIAVHEVGHWMNLYHTFQGGCEEPGDHVDDTPASESPSQGCPVGRNSCEDSEGLDPIHNHMDYSDDSCRDEFTDGQQERMIAQWTEWRSKSS